MIRGPTNTIWISFETSGLTLRTVTLAPTTTAPEWIRVVTQDAAARILGLEADGASEHGENHGKKEAMRNFTRCAETIFSSKHTWEPRKWSSYLPNFPSTNSASPSGDWKEIYPSSWACQGTTERFDVLRSPKCLFLLDTSVATFCGARDWPIDFARIEAKG